MTYTPGATVGLWRVDSTLQATNLSTGTMLFDLAAPATSTGPWGNFVYASSLDGKLRRIDMTGAMTAIVENLGGEGGLTFGPDGALYFTDIAGHAIHRLTVCTP